jgi:hypothetical protein
VDIFINQVRRSSRVILLRIVIVANERGKQDQI